MSCFFDRCISSQFFVNNYFEFNKKLIQNSGLSRNFIFGTISIIGALGVSYGAIYLYNETRNKKLLSDYYEKRFFEKTTINPERRKMFYDKNSIDGELLVSSDVKLKVLSIKINDNNIEYVKYKKMGDNEKKLKSDNVLIYFGGTREDAGDVSSVLTELVKETGVTIISPNYPGYGLSMGKSTFDNNQKMANTFIEDYHRLHPDKNIILMGYSYGASVTIDAAYKHRSVDNLIIISAYASAKKEGWDYAKWYEKPLIPFAIHKDKNNNIDMIKHMPSRFSSNPLGITSLHGKADETVPYSQQEVLYQASRINVHVSFSTIGTYYDTHLSIKQGLVQPIIATINCIIKRNEGATQN